MGALYGVAAEMGPRRIGRNPVLPGLGFGAALFAGADEVVVPALRLSKSPAQASWSEHLYGFVSHLVYGTTAAAVFRASCCWALALSSTARGPLDCLGYRKPCIDGLRISLVDLSAESTNFGSRVIVPEVSPPSQRKLQRTGSLGCRPPPSFLPLEF